MFARRLPQHPHSSRAPSFFSILAPIFYDGPDEIVARKPSRGQRALPPWGADVCVSLPRFGWPMRGFPQSSTGSTIIEVLFNSLFMRFLLTLEKSSGVSLTL